MGRAGRSRVLIILLLPASLGAPACRDEVVQTASRVPNWAPLGGGAGGAEGRGPLDCGSAAAQNALPPGVAFGDGAAVESWPLIGSSYGPLEGPGLHVTARDAFRVFVNGHLVGQSEAARTPIFLPLSLLPGENVIAVSVNAEDGTPAALVALEELEQSYASASDWRVSTAPGGDWTALGYDDTGWALASEFARIGSLPGCDPAAPFPESSAPVWIGPKLGTAGPIALRRVIRVDPVGFAAGTTGGADAPPQSVSTWAELEALAASDVPATLLLDEGVHDFRRTGAEIQGVEVCPASCSEDPPRTVYQVPTAGAPCASALIAAERSERVLHLGSDKTIVGLGRGAAIRGVTFDLGASHNIIVRNVALFDVNRALLEAGDAFTLSQASGVWIDHATVKWVSDAFVDAGAGTGNVTISYALFDGGTAAECNGQERWALTFTDAQATIHHSRFDQVSTHAPFADGSLASVHLFNNVYSNSADWTVGSGCLAQLLLEGSVFENVEVVSRLSTCNDTTDRGLMSAASRANLYKDGTVVFVGGDGTEPHDAVFIPEYDYELEGASEAWARVILRAGMGGPWALPLSLD